MGMVRSATVLVLRFGMVHETGCDDLKNTRDWIPLQEFSEEALADIDLRHCSACLDSPVDELVDAAESTVRAPVE